MQSARPHGSVRVLFVSLGLLSILGCRGAVEPMPDIPETVEYDTVKLEYGGEDGSEKPPERSMETDSQMLVGGTSRIALFTRRTVTRTNALMRWVFRLIDSIQEYPPSSRDGKTFRWTGYPNGTYVRFVSSYTGERSYRYRMWAGNGPRDNALIFEGTFTRLDPDEKVQQGYGRIRFDFDASKKFNATQQTEGEMTMAFRVRNGVRQMRVLYLDFRGRESDEKVDALNRYTERPSGRVRFKLFGKGNFDAGGAGGADKEFLSVDSAYLGDRRGRAAARIEGGDLSRTWTVEQCWDASETVVWERSMPSYSGNGGDESDCAPPLRSLELSPPPYSEPSGPPEIPDPHPEE